MSTSTLHIYRWHSVNLVPSWDIFPVKVEAHPGEVQITGRTYQLTLFGIVFTLTRTYPGAPSTSRSFNLIGPLWSRKSRRWYRANPL
jgi:hypothetical protein